MNSTITNCLLMHNNSIAQAYLYALERMNMSHIIKGLKRALNNPGIKHRIVLFEHNYTKRENQWRGNVRTQLQNGVYLDETFYTGLFQLLRCKFDMSLREVDVYHRAKYMYDGSPNPHVRQVVLSVASGGGGGM